MGYVQFKGTDWSESFGQGALRGMQIGNQFRQSKAQYDYQNAMEAADAKRDEAIKAAGDDQEKIKAANFAHDTDARTAYRNSQVYLGNIPEAERARQTDFKVDTMRRYAPSGEDTPIPQTGALGGNQPAPQATKASPQSAQGAQADPLAEEKANYAAELTAQIQQNPYLPLSDASKSFNDGYGRIFDNMNIQVGKDGRSLAVSQGGGPSKTMELSPDQLLAVQEKWKQKQVDARFPANPTEPTSDAASGVSQPSVLAGGAPAPTEAVQAADVDPRVAQAPQQAPIQVADPRVAQAPQQAESKVVDPRVAQDPQRVAVQQAAPQQAVAQQGAPQQAAPAQAIPQGAARMQAQQVPGQDGYSWQPPEEYEYLRKREMEQDRFARWYTKMFGELPPGYGAGNLHGVMKDVESFRLKSRELDAKEKSNDLRERYVDALTLRRNAKEGKEVEFHRERAASTPDGQGANITDGNGMIYAHEYEVQTDKGYKYVFTPPGMVKTTAANILKTAPTFPVYVDKKIVKNAKGDPIPLFGELLRDPHTAQSVYVLNVDPDTGKPWPKGENVHYWNLDKVQRYIETHSNLKMEEDPNKKGEGSGTSTEGGAASNKPRTAEDIAASENEGSELGWLGMIKGALGGNKSLEANSAKGTETPAKPKAMPTGEGKIGSSSSTSQSSTSQTDEGKQIMDDDGNIIGDDMYMDNEPASSAQRKTTSKTESSKSEDSGKSDDRSASNITAESFKRDAKKALSQMNADTDADQKAMYNAGKKAKEITLAAVKKLKGLSKEALDVLNENTDRDNKRLRDAGRKIKETADEAYAKAKAKAKARIAKTNREVEDAGREIADWAEERTAPAREAVTGAVKRLELADRTFEHIFKSGIKGAEKGARERYGQPDSGKSWKQELNDNQDRDNKALYNLGKTIKKGAKPAAEMAEKGADAVEANARKRYDQPDSGKSWKQELNDNQDRDNKLLRDTGKAISFPIKKAVSAYKSLSKEPIPMNEEDRKAMRQARAYREGQRKQTAMRIKKDNDTAAFYAKQKAKFEQQSRQADVNNFNTKLTPSDEKAFQKDVAKAKRQSDLVDYDLRGYWKELKAKGKSLASVKGHFPDKYKKPNHPTFSEDSIYHGKQGLSGGKWTQRGGKWVFTPGARLSEAQANRLKAYFKKFEPNAELNLKNRIVGKNDSAIDLIN